MTAAVGAQLRRDWLLFAVMTFLFSFGWNTYDAVFQNFFREAMGGGPMQLGILEAIRETPGLIAALMAGILVALAEKWLAALGLVICGVLIALTGVAHDFWTLVLITTSWSVGFHLWSTAGPSITLHLSQGLEGGKHLARMRSVGAIATISALGLGALAKWLNPQVGYKAFFVTGGATIAMAGLVAFGLSGLANGGKRQPLILRKEYGLYYLLQFLEGCRRQIFGIFALFTLIMVYKTPAETVILLRLVYSILSAITAPTMGRWIDRVGEKGPLTLYACGIITLFVGYATISNVTILYALYIIDNVLFTFSVGLNTYLHRIVRPGELTPCVAMGVTMNHVAAVSLPLAGALLWKQSGNYQLPFFLGVILAVIALGATQFIPHVQPKLAKAE